MPDIKRPTAGILADEPMSESSSIQTPETKKGGFFKVLVIIIIIAVIILVGLYLISLYTNWNVLNVSKTADVQPSGWSAVFLTNGQVYFGKITNETEGAVLLTDVYYLQVTTQIQPADSTNPGAEEQNVSLVKLGNELHGPKDAMKINMAHILFTEDLKEDSRVVDAIVRYLQENK